MCSLQIECGANQRPELLIINGPTLNVQIGFDQNYQTANNSAPNLPAVEYFALIDTGAMESCIDSSIAINLGLPVVDEVSISGVHGANKVNVHLAQIHIPALRFTIYGRFCGVHLHAGGQPHSALLGKTFLRHVTMNYEGNSGSVTLVYR